MICKLNGFLGAWPGNSARTGNESTKGQLHRHRKQNQLSLYAAEAQATNYTRSGRGNPFTRETKIHANRHTDGAGTGD